MDPLVHWPLFPGDIRDFDFGTIRDPIDLISRWPPLPALLAGWQASRSPG